MRNNTVYSELKLSDLLLQELEKIKAYNSDLLLEREQFLHKLESMTLHFKNMEIKLRKSESK